MINNGESNNREAIINKVTKDDVGNYIDFLEKGGTSEEVLMGIYKKLETDPELLDDCSNVKMVVQGYMDEVMELYFNNELAFGGKEMPKDEVIEMYSRWKKANGDIYNNVIREGGKYYFENSSGGVFSDLEISKFSLSDKFSKQKKELTPAEIDDYNKHRERVELRENSDKIFEVAAGIVYNKIVEAISDYASRNPDADPVPDSTFIQDEIINKIFEPNTPQELRTYLFRDPATEASLGLDANTLDSIFNASKIGDLTNYLWAYVFNTNSKIGEKENILKRISERLETARTQMMDDYENDSNGVRVPTKKKGVARFKKVSEQKTARWFGEKNPGVFDVTSELITDLRNQTWIKDLGLDFTKKEDALTLLLHMHAALEKEGLLIKGYDNNDKLKQINVPEKLGKTYNFIVLKLESDKDVVKILQALDLFIGELNQDPKVIIDFANGAGYTRMDWIKVQGSSDMLELFSAFNKRAYDKYVKIIKENKEKLYGKGQISEFDLEEIIDNDLKLFFENCHSVSGWGFNHVKAEMEKKNEQMKKEILAKVREALKEEALDKTREKADPQELRKEAISWFFEQGNNRSELEAKKNLMAEELNELKEKREEAFEVFKNEKNGDETNEELVRETLVQTLIDDHKHIEGDIDTKYEEILSDEEKLLDFIEANQRIRNEINKDNQIIVLEYCKKNYQKKYENAFEKFQKTTNSDGLTPLGELMSGDPKTKQESEKVALLWLVDLRPVFKADLDDYLQKNMGDHYKKTDEGSKEMEEVLTIKYYKEAINKHPDKDKINQQIAEQAKKELKRLIDEKIDQMKTPDESSLKKLKEAFVKTSEFTSLGAEPTEENLEAYWGTLNASEKDELKTKGKELRKQDKYKNLVKEMCVEEKNGIAEALKDPTSEIYQHYVEGGMKAQLEVAFVAYAGKSPESKAAKLPELLKKIKEIEAQNDKIETEFLQSKEAELKEAEDIILKEKIEKEIQRISGELNQEELKQEAIDALISESKNSAAYYQLLRKFKDGLSEEEKDKLTGKLKEEAKKLPEFREAVKKKLEDALNKNLSNKVDKKISKDFGTEIDKETRELAEKEANIEWDKEYQKALEKYQNDNPTEITGKRTIIKDQLEKNKEVKRQIHREALEALFEDKLEEDLLLRADIEDLIEERLEESYEKLVRDKNKNTLENFRNSQDGKKIVIQARAIFIETLDLSDEEKAELKADEENRLNQLVEKKLAEEIRSYFEKTKEYKDLEDRVSYDALAADDTKVTFLKDIRQRIEAKYKNDPEKRKNAEEQVKAIFDNEDAQNKAIDAEIDKLLGDTDSAEYKKYISGKMDEAMNAKFQAEEMKNHPELQMTDSAIKTKMEEIKLRKIEKALLGDAGENMSVFDKTYEKEMITDERVRRMMEMMKVLSTVKDINDAKDAYKYLATKAKRMDTKISDYISQQGEEVEGENVLKLGLLDVNKKIEAEAERQARKLVNSILNEQKWVKGAGFFKNMGKVLKGEYLRAKEGADEERYFQAIRDLLQAFFEKRGLKDHEIKILKELQARKMMPEDGPKLEQFRQDLCAEFNGIISNSFSFKDELSDDKYQEGEGMHELVGDCANQLNLVVREYLKSGDSVALRAETCRISEMIANDPDNEVKKLHNNFTQEIEKFRREHEANLSQLDIDNFVTKVYLIDDNKGTLNTNVKLTWINRIAKKTIRGAQALGVAPQTAFLVGSAISIGYTIATKQVARAAKWLFGGAVLGGMIYGAARKVGEARRRGNEVDFRLEGGEYGQAQAENIVSPDEQKLYEIFSTKSRDYSFQEISEKGKMMHEKMKDPDKALAESGGNCNMCFEDIFKFISELEERLYYGRKIQKGFIKYTNEFSSNREQAEIFNLIKELKEKYIEMIMGHNKKSFFSNPIVIGYGDMASHDKILKYLNEEILKNQRLEVRANLDSILEDENRLFRNFQIKKGLLGAGTAAMLGGVFYGIGHGVGWLLDEYREHIGQGTSAIISIGGEEYKMNIPEEVTKANPSNQYNDIDDLRKALADKGYNLDESIIKGAVIGGNDYNVLIGGKNETYKLPDELYNELKERSFPNREAFNEFLHQKGYNIHQDPSSVTTPGQYIPGSNGGGVDGVQGINPIELEKSVPGSTYKIEGVKFFDYGTHSRTATEINENNLHFLGKNGVVSDHEAGYSIKQMFNHDSSQIGVDGGHSGDIAANSIEQSCKDGKMFLGAYIDDSGTVIKIPVNPDGSIPIDFNDPKMGAIYKSLFSTDGGKLTYHGKALAVIMTEGGDPARGNVNILASILGDNNMHGHGADIPGKSIVTPGTIETLPGRGITTNHDSFVPMYYFTDPRITIGSAKAYEHKNISSIVSKENETGKIPIPDGGTNFRRGMQGRRNIIDSFGGGFVEKKEVTDIIGGFALRAKTVEDEILSLSKEISDEKDKQVANIPQGDLSFDDCKQKNKTYFSTKGRDMNQSDFEQMKTDGAIDNQGYITKIKLENDDSLNNLDVLLPHLKVLELKNCKLTGKLPGSLEELNFSTVEAPNLELGNIQLKKIEVEKSGKISFENLNESRFSLEIFNVDKESAISLQTKQFDFSEFNKLKEFTGEISTDSAKWPNNPVEIKKGANAFKFKIWNDSEIDVTKLPALSEAWDGYELTNPNNDRIGIIPDRVNP